MSDLPRRSIPAGSAAPVWVASKIAQESGDFSHSATIFTNDPENPEITLRIRGAIRRHLAAHPPLIALSGMRRGESKSVEVVIYSQVWEEFDVDDLASSLEGVTWRVAPARPDTLATLDACSGYRLQVTVPSPDLPDGHFRRQLRMSVAPHGESAPPRAFAVDIVGKVLRRISLSGRKLDSQRVLQLGTVRQGEGARERLMMKVRDDHRELVVHRVESEPEFLRVSVAPVGEEAQKLGLYTIEVEVPGDAPISDFLTNRGQIRIQTDHPAVPTITLEVAFAVAGR